MKHLVLIAALFLPASVLAADADGCVQRDQYGYCLKYQTPDDSGGGFGSWMQDAEDYYERQKKEWGMGFEDPDKNSQCTGYWENGVCHDIND